MKKGIKEKLILIFILVFFIGGAFGIYILASKAIAGTKMTTAKTTKEKVTGNFTGVTSREKTTANTKSENNNSNSSNSSNASGKNKDNLKDVKMEPLTLPSSTKKVTEDTSKTIELSGISYKIPSGYLYATEGGYLTLSDENKSFIATIIFVENLELSDFDNSGDEEEVEDLLDGITCTEEGRSNSGSVNYLYNECSDADNDKFVIAVTDSKKNGVFLVVIYSSSDKYDHTSLKKVISEVLVEAL